MQGSSHMFATAEDRRNQFIRRQLPDTWSTAETEVARRAAERKYDDVLAYFDEHEPALGDAIRYGLKDVVWCEDCEDFLPSPDHEDDHVADQPLYRIEKL